MGHISCKYDIDRTMKPQTDYSQYIIPVCELLQQGKKIKEIYEILNVPGGSYDRVRVFIGNIKNGKTYTEISCNYNF